MLSLEKARQFYEQNDAAHDFDHVQRVYATALKLAELEGADREIVAAAALLHDVVGAAPGTEERKKHHLASAEFAGRVLREEGWEAGKIEAVQACIRGHRFRGEAENKPSTLEAQIIFDADKLDVIGAIGTARTLAYAVIAGKPFFVEPSASFLENGKLAEGEQYSAYHEYLFKLQYVHDRMFTLSARKLAEQRMQAMREYFIQLAAEMRNER